MTTRPRVCPECGKDVDPDAPVRYSTAGIFHDLCYDRFSRRGGRRR